MTTLLTYPTTTHFLLSKIFHPRKSRPYQKSTPQTLSRLSEVEPRPPKVQRYPETDKMTPRIHSNRSKAFETCPGKSANLTYMDNATTPTTNPMPYAPETNLQEFEPGRQTRHETFTWVRPRLGLSLFEPQRKALPTPVGSGTAAELSHFLTACRNCGETKFNNCPNCQTHKVFH